MTCILYYAIFLTIVPQAAEEGVDLSGSKRELLKVHWLLSFVWYRLDYGFQFRSISYWCRNLPLGIRSFAQSLVMVLHLLINMVILRHYLK